MTPQASSKDPKKSRRIRRGIAAIVIAAAGVGGVVAGPLSGTSHAGSVTVTVTASPVRSSTGIFW